MGRVKSLIGLALFLAAAPAPPQVTPGEYRLSADVNQVVLPVTVVDHKGRLVIGLGADQFRVYQDGRPQQIRYFSQRDIPVSVGLVIDHSVSMTPKQADTVEAALRFVRLSNPGDEAFVVNFNENVSFGLSEAFSSNSQELREALLNRPCMGRTALYDAVIAALEHVAKGTRDKKALIVVSDGGDNASRHSLQDALEQAQRSGVLIYTVGLFDEAGVDQRPGVLKKLARLTGGEVFLPSSSEDLASICSQIARDLRNQYTLAYTPDGADGRYHRIQVIAVNQGRKLAARTRAGYWAPAEAGGNPRTSR